MILKQYFSLQLNHTIQGNDSMPAKSCKLRLHEHCLEFIDKLKNIMDTRDRIKAHLSGTETAVTKSNETMWIYSNKCRGKLSGIDCTLLYNNHTCAVGEAAADTRCIQNTPIAI